VIRVYASIFDKSTLASRKAAWLSVEPNREPRMLRPSSLDGVQGSLGTFAAVEIKRGALVVKETGDLLEGRKWTSTA